MHTILFTGLGSIGRRHLRLLMELESEFDIHAYRSRGSDGELDAVTEHDSLDSALAVSPDVAFITNPTSLHVETAIRCAKSGADLFIEKPLSDSIGGIDELRRICDEKELLTYVGCQLRFDPILNRLKTILIDEEYGGMLSFRAYSGSYLPDWRPEKDYRNTYSAQYELGGGVALDLIHEIDYSYWIFGRPARTVHLSGQASTLETTVEDYVELSLETVDGVPGHIHLDYFRPTPRRTLEVTCEDGVLTADLICKTLTIETTERTEQIEYDYHRDDVFRRQLNHFFDYLERREPFENDISEAEDVLRIALNLRNEYR
ncbi:Gfo/Idh/MocA family protein [Haloferax namakaokahaiae]|uniref:Gfo/Idh/MocA family protein n=1 Tax=Haloferax namakaokahaiae TaxID=1748331 RepID=A0ABD5ZEE5_9EURY